MPPVHAELYKWVDKDGRTIYSDSPPPADIKDAKSKKFGDNVSGPSDNLPFELREAAKKIRSRCLQTNCGEQRQCKDVCSIARHPVHGAQSGKDPAAADALKKLINTLEVPVMLAGDSPSRGFFR